MNPYSFIFYMKFININIILYVSKKNHLMLCQFHSNRSLANIHQPPQRKLYKNSLQPISNITFILIIDSLLNTNVSECYIWWFCVFKSVKRHVFILNIILYNIVYIYTIHTHLVSQNKYVTGCPSCQTQLYIKRAKSNSFFSYVQSG